MPKTSKRPSSRRRSAPLDFSDSNRVPVPGLTQSDPNYARYTITPLGRVYRDDGRLLTPRPDLSIKFNGNKSKRSLPKLVFLAFGDPYLIERWRDGDLRGYDAWLKPFGPRDELHGQPRCTVYDVALVPHTELILYGRYGRLPETVIPIRHDCTYANPADSTD